MTIQLWRNPLFTPLAGSLLISLSIPFYLLGIPLFVWCDPGFQGPEHIWPWVPGQWKFCHSKYVNWFFCLIALPLFDISLWRYGDGDLKAVPFMIYKKPPKIRQQSFKFVFDMFVWLRIFYKQLFQCPLAEFYRYFFLMMGRLLLANLIIKVTCSRLSAVEADGCQVSRLLRGLHDFIPTACVHNMRRYLYQS